MKARPIIFKPDMVRAILDGRKTQTRRVVKDQPPGGDCRELHEVVWGDAAEKLSAGRDERRSKAWAGFTDSRAPESVAYYGCPYGQPGDLLWVRETWRNCGYHDIIHYRADGHGLPGSWKPSIFMPRRLSRLTLRITGVRVERLQDIGEVDAHREGITLGMLPYNPSDPHPCRTWFRGLWESINGPDSWAENPWVWVIDFEPIQANVDDVLREAA